MSFWKKKKEEKYTCWKCGEESGHNWSPCTKCCKYENELEDRLEKRKQKKYREKRDKFLTQLNKNGGKK